MTRSLKNISLIALLGLTIFFSSCNEDENIIYTDKYPMPEPDFDVEVVYNRVKFINKSKNYDTLQWQLDQHEFSYKKNPTYTFNSTGTKTVYLKVGYGQFFRTIRKYVYINTMPPDAPEMRVRDSRWYGTALEIFKLPQEGQVLSSVLQVSSDSNFNEPVIGKASIIPGDTFEFNSEINLAPYNKEPWLTTRIALLKPQTNYYFKATHVFKADTNGHIDTFKMGPLKVTTSEFVDVRITNLSAQKVIVDYFTARYIRDGAYRNTIKKDLIFSFKSDFSEPILPHGFQKLGKFDWSFARHAGTRLYLKYKVSLKDHPEYFAEDTVSFAHYNGFLSRNYKSKDISQSKNNNGFTIIVKHPTRGNLTLNLPNRNTTDNSFDIETGEELQHKNYVSLYYSNGYGYFSNYTDPCKVFYWTYDNKRYFFEPITYGSFEQRGIILRNKDQTSGNSVLDVNLSIELE